MNKDGPLQLASETYVSSTLFVKHHKKNCKMLTKQLLL